MTTAKTRPLPSSARVGVAAVSGLMTLTGSSAVVMRGAAVTERLCLKCGENEPGLGGILCPGCKTAIETRIYPSTNPALAAELDRKLGGGTEER